MPKLGGWHDDFACYPPFRESNRKHMPLPSLRAIVLNKLHHWQSTVDVTFTKLSDEAGWLLVSVKADVPGFHKNWGAKSNY